MGKNIPLSGVLQNCSLGLWAPGDAEGGKALLWSRATPVG